MLPVRLKRSRRAGFIRVAGFPSSILVLGVLIAALYAWVPKDLLLPFLSMNGGVQRSEGMVKLPGGQFTQGKQWMDATGSKQADCSPPHKVSVRPFWIDEHEVTNVQFAKFVEATKYISTAEQSGYGYVFDPTQRKWVSMRGANWRQPTGPGSTLAGRDNLPVVQVSWHDAVAYCNWAGKRLPTEAEWEMAARGGLRDGDFPWGGTGTIADVAKANTWQGQFPHQDMAQDGVAGIAPVGKYPANPYGLYDMAGNVAEWCGDWYAEDFYQGAASDNPTGPTTGQDRVVRGGSWISAESTGASYRVWVREHLPPTTANNHTGFRCVKNAQ